MLLFLNKISKNNFNFGCILWFYNCCLCDFYDVIFLWTTNTEIENVVSVDRINMIMSTIQWVAIIFCVSVVCTKIALLFILLESSSFFPSTSSHESKCLMFPYNWLWLVYLALCALDNIHKAMQQIHIRVNVHFTWGNPTALSLPFYRQFLCFLDKNCSLFAPYNSQCLISSKSARLSPKIVSNLTFILTKI